MPDGIIIIKRPRAVIREVLTDETNREQFDAGTLSYIDSVLAKEDAQWTRAEFRKLHTFFGDCD
jgi:hypothetical protein